MKARQIFYILSLVITSSIGLLSIQNSNFLWAFIVFIPLILLGFFDVLQTKHTIRRNFPVIGNIRYLLEKIRPEIMQYFVETDTQGRPIDRLHRNLIYERSKKTNDTTPFGTQLDVYGAGYEWMEHSIYAKNHTCEDCEPRVLVGGKDCLQPYSASILNISAMSFGSLSKNAVLAMNTGAKIGGFAHNTGEGGISPYHKQPGGDLIWQIGTGYFGCRTENGDFNSEKFKENATLDNVKMIEIKISQGAKPGHGGILPAAKNTKEIAAIRHVKPHTDVLSPPGHTAFTTPDELMTFIQKLRDLSGGKPIGFKICIGKKSEFIAICKAMVNSGIKPDFITIDGGEGGTGAAPVEFSNSVGMPLRDGLTFAIDTLIGYNLKKDIKVIASGKVFTSFHMARLIAVGADMINSARAMMMATGCIQALQCNRNTCPVGVATQDERLMKGLVVKDKSQRVANYHQETIKSFLELLAASGVTEPNELKREHISRRVEMNEVLNYSQIYPEITPGQYLKTEVDQRLKRVDK
ncbi:glutamate synthase domain-containing protein 2 [Wenyingzhuangia heitensis]|uniref:Glutamate synthase domain-containing protein 2 n=1 Tax=Wenyingzhuangia heitensis TaxID=1487859 RepID=A0ABX0UAZ2_9FLAO|nr:FMN-binding glutamate synthase family protein [Wenyingzhuangia heitensis]NIJ44995.1 glutamate synthase domain-containing protein 2 [Wenyingzhuangia heitensis]